MNQFMKRALISAMIMLGVGLIICFICVGIGGASLLTNIKNVTIDDSTISDHLSNFEGSININDIKINNGEFTCDFDTHYSTHNGIFTDDSAANTNDIDELHIDIGGGTCIITESDDDKIHIISDSIGEYQYYTKGDTFYVTGFKQKNVNNISKVIKDNHLEIQIPKGFEFKDVSLELGAGEMSIDSLLCKKDVSIEIGAGDVTIKELHGKDVNFEIGAGNLTIQDGYITEGKFDVGLGNLSYNGFIEKDLSAACGMGNIDLTLDEKSTDHNYKLSCAMGNISIGKNDYSGAAFDKDLDHDASHTYSLDCAMGNIEVIFQK